MICGLTGILTNVNTSEVLLQLCHTYYVLYVYIVHTSRGNGQLSIVDWPMQFLFFLLTYSNT